VPLGKMASQWISLLLYLQHRGYRGEVMSHECNNHL
jgi:hypothetical protein